MNKLITLVFLLIAHTTFAATPSFKSLKSAVANLDRAIQTLQGAIPQSEFTPNAPIHGLVDVSAEIKKFNGDTTNLSDDEGLKKIGITLNLIYGDYASGMKPEKISAVYPNSTNLEKAFERTIRQTRALVRMANRSGDDTAMEAAQTVDEKLQALKESLSALIENTDDIEVVVAQTSDSNQWDIYSLALFNTASEEVLVIQGYEGE